MGSVVLLALLVVAAIWVASWLPLVAGAWQKLRELQTGRAGREAAFLASAPALALASLSFDLRKNASLVNAFPDSSCRVDRPDGGGPSVVGACGQPVDGDSAHAVALLLFAVNGLSIRTVHTVPQARSTAVPRLIPGDDACSHCGASDCAVPVFAYTPPLAGVLP